MFLSKLARRNLAVIVAVIALAASKLADAADLPVKAPAQASAMPPYDWTGFYAGVHLGFATGRSDWSATQPSGAANLSGSLDLTRAYDLFTGTGSHLGGFQAGYNYMFGSRTFAGVEADISFPGMGVERF